MRKNSRLQKYQYGPLVMRTVSAAISMLLLSLSIPTGSPAASLTGNSNTYLQSRESAGGANLMPLYEYLDFNVQNLGK